MIPLPGGNWEAESGHHNTGGDKSDDRYFINLCHEVINSEATTKCPEGAAACWISKFSLSAFLFC